MGCTTSKQEDIKGDNPNLKRPEHRTGSQPQCASPETPQTSTDALKNVDDKAKADPSEARASSGDQPTDPSAGTRDPNFASSKQGATPEQVTQPNSPGGSGVATPDTPLSPEEIAKAAVEQEFPSNALDGKEFTLSEEDKDVELPKGIKYRGKWLNGRQHGVGQLTYPDGSTYLGEFVDGKPHGKGIYTNKDASKLEGNFIEGKANGYGVYYFPDNSRYFGPFVDDKRDGRGREVQANGMEYIGEYKKGRQHGQGTLKSPQGDVYEGAFANGELEGYGVYKWPDGRIYKGQWKRSAQAGEGELTWPDGRVYKGNYENGKCSGQGVMIWPDGRMYDGAWKNGLENGRGKYYARRGEYREGQFMDGVRIKWLGEPVTVDASKDESLPVPTAQEEKPEDNPSSGGMTDFLQGKPHKIDSNVK